MARGRWSGRPVRLRSFPCDSRRAPAGDRDSDCRLPARRGERGSVVRSGLSAGGARPSAGPSGRAGARPGGRLESGSSSRGLRFPLSLRGTPRPAGRRDGPDRVAGAPLRRARGRMVVPFHLRLRELSRSFRAGRPALLASLRMGRRDRPRDRPGLDALGRPARPDGTRRERSGDGGRGGDSRESLRFVLARGGSPVLFHRAPQRQGRPGKDPARRPPRRGRRGRGRLSRACRTVAARDEPVLRVREIRRNRHVAGDVARRERREGRPAAPAP